MCLGVGREVPNEVIEGDGMVVGERQERIFEVGILGRNSEWDGIKCG